jgi:hypothetical protein
VLLTNIDQQGALGRPGFLWLMAGFLFDRLPARLAAKEKRQLYVWKEMPVLWSKAW